MLARSVFVKFEHSRVHNNISPNFAKTRNFFPQFTFDFTSRLHFREIYQFVNVSILPPPHPLMLCKDEAFLNVSCLKLRT